MLRETTSLPFPVSRSSSLDLVLQIELPRRTPFSKAAGTAREIAIICRRPPSTTRPTSSVRSACGRSFAVHIQEDAARPREPAATGSTPDRICVARMSHAQAHATVHRAQSLLKRRRRASENAYRTAHDCGSRPFDVVFPLRTSRSTGIVFPFLAVGPITISRDPSALLKLEPLADLRPRPSSSR